MIKENDLLEPRKLYKLSLKDSHHKNAEEFFDELVKKSGVSEIENENKVNAYKNKKQTFEKEAHTLHKLNNQKALFIFLVVLHFVLTFIGIIIAIVLFTKGNFFGFIPSILSTYFLGMGIYLIIHINKKIKVKIEKQNNLVETLKKESKDLLNICYKQMAPLNNLYDWNLAPQLITTTIPLIKMDKYFDNDKFYYLKNKYGFKENDDPKESTVYVQSGSILGNPFLIERHYCQSMKDHVYTGTKIIHWTTMERDSKGNLRTVHHSETLVAHVSKPEPYYYYDTWLIYGNDAAPKLNFTRSPVGANTMSDAKKKHFVKSSENKLKKKAEKSIKEGGNFTYLANTEFEAFFNALDRDNEVDFRLLFTPLAQKNMLDLITNKEPFGDDFIFVKKGPLNYIKTVHSQNADINGDPSRFYHYDLKEAKKIFTNYADEYLLNFFFDMAPLLSIPLYQQNKAHDYIYSDVYKSNFTSFEGEVMANSMDYNLFKPAKCTTNIILKAEFNHKDKKVDCYNIHAYGFIGVEMLAFIPVHGGDGRWHDVPVPWIDYRPIKTTKHIKMAHIKANKNEFENKRNTEEFKKIFNNKKKTDNISFQRGLISFICNDKETFDSDELDKIFA